MLPCRRHAGSEALERSELVADRFQFSLAFCGHYRVGHLEITERIQDNLGNNQPGILFVVGGDDVPRRVMGAGGAQASLISLRVLLPVFPLVDVRDAELPVLARLIDALEEAFALLAFREMEEELDDPGSIAVEMFLQVNDGTRGPS